MSQIGSTADPLAIPAASAAPSRTLRPPALDLAAVVALSAAVFFSHLGSFGFWEPDEGRYAEIAREMLERGNLAGLIVPHLNYVAYVEKPPLLYWLTTLSFGAFGVGEFAARLPVALAAVAGVLAAYYFAFRAFDRRRAVLTAAVLTTTPLYALLAQVLTTDMLLTALVTVATFALFLHWQSGGRWCWIAYVAMGLAMLAKGPVGAVLPVLSMLAFLAWNRELKLPAVIRRFHALPGCALSLLIAAPWFVVMTMRVPGFFDFYFIGEHLRRAFDSNYSHSEPFYFYGPVLALGLLPWSLLVPFLTWRESPRNPARRFCLCAAVVTLVLFSSATSKLIPYVLPALPFLAVLIADGLAACAWPSDRARAARRPPDSRILIESGPALSLAGVGLLVAAAEAAHFRSPYVLAVQPALLAIGAILLLGGIATTAMFAARRAAAGLGAIVITMALALIAGGWARLEAEPLRSYAALGRAVAEKAPGAALICYHRYVQSLAFYNRRRVILVGPKSELDFGAHRADDAADWFFDTDGQLLALWERPGPAVLVIDAVELARLRERLGDFELIAAEGHKRAVLRRVPIAAN